MMAINTAIIGIITLASMNLSRWLVVIISEPLTITRMTYWAETVPIVSVTDTFVISKGLDLRTVSGRGHGLAKVWMIPVLIIAGFTHNIISITRTMVTLFVPMNMFGGSLS